jgi:hypothetical protein
MPSEFQYSSFVNAAYLVTALALAGLAAITLFQSYKNNSRLLKIDKTPKAHKKNQKKPYKIPYAQEKSPK